MNSNILPSDLFLKKRGAGSEQFEPRCKILVMHRCACLECGTPFIHPASVRGYDLSRGFLVSKNHLLWRSESKLAKRLQVEKLVVISRACGWTVYHHLRRVIQEGV